MPGQKRYRILPLERPVWRAFQSVTQAWPQSILFGQAGFIILQRVCQRLAVVPRHPLRWVGRQFLGVPLQLGQIVERVGAAQLAGVDQAHEQVADLRPVQGPIEQGVLAVQNRPLQCSFDQIVIQRRPASRRNSVSAFQCRSRYVIALPRPEFGSVFRSANCASSQPCSLSISGPLCS